MKWKGAFGFVILSKSFLETKLFLFWSCSYGPSVWFRRIIGNIAVVFEVALSRCARW